MSGDPRPRFASVPDEQSQTAEFLRSMPAVYAARFGPEIVRKHAEIALRRGADAAHAEVWEEQPGGIAGICVVAEDRPGLLSLISFVLVRQGLDVNAAQIYGRLLPSGVKEAVDLFWVRRADARRTLDVETPNATDIAVVARELDRLLSRPETGDVKVSSPQVRPLASTRRRARFAFDAETSEVVLTVEVAQRPGLLLAVTRALFELGTQIVRSDVLTIRGRAVDRFHVTELDGRPLTPARRMEIEVAIEQRIA